MLRAISVLLLLSLPAFASGDWWSPPDRRHVDQLSERFWVYMRNNEVDELRDWQSDARLWLFSHPFSRHRNHFYKKIGMADILLTSINGGSSDFQWSSMPAILSTTSNALAAYHSDPNDGFSQRMYLTYDKLVLSVFTGYEQGALIAIDEIIEAANNPDLKPFQKPVFLEVAGTLLLTAHDPDLVKRGVELLEEAISLSLSCKTADCLDALTLAPHFEAMNHLSVAEGYAMLRRSDDMERSLARAFAAGEAKQWPYLDEVRDYAPTIWHKFSTTTQVKKPFSNGFKVEQPFLFNHANGCHYCHVGQESVPVSYMPLGYVEAQPTENWGE